MPAREIEVADWLAVVRELAAEGFGALTVVDRAEGLWLVLRTAADTELEVRLDGNQAPSIVGVWPMAATVERRLAEQFAIAFDSEPTAGSGWLRKRVLLAARNETDWPGVRDPSDKAGSPSRRKSLPLGVLADAAAVEAGEVELR